MTHSAWLAAQLEAFDFAPVLPANGTARFALSDPTETPSVLDRFEFRFERASVQEDDDSTDANETDGTATQSLRTTTTETAATETTLDFTPDWLDRLGTGDRTFEWGSGNNARRERYPGLNELTVEHDGLMRDIIIDVPDGFDPTDTTTTYSAVLVFHGNGGNASNMVRIGFSDAGEEEDFIAVYLNAEGGRWTNGRETTEIDDVGFVLSVIDLLVEEWNVDADTVFAAGHSNGGMFVQRLADEVPDAFAGYGVVNANMPSTLGEAAQSDTDEPIVFFHGTEDEQMPYEGWTLPRGGTVYGADDTIDYWATYNGTEMGDFTMMPDIADDGMTTSVRVSDDGSVVQYVTDGGGHAWPGLDRWNDRTGEPTQDIEATDIIVDFFSDYGL